MATNKFDQSIKEKFDNRTIEPSISAWERLSVQLDQQAQKKSRGWFFYIAIAASITVLLSVGVYLFTSETEKLLPKDEFVVTPELNQSLENEIDKVLEEIPNETVIVTNEPHKQDQNNSKDIVQESREKVVKKTINQKIASPTKAMAVSTIQENEIQDKIAEKIHNIDQITDSLSIKEAGRRNSQSQQKVRIKIDPDALLYAVTHSPKEVKVYYAKYSIDRTEVLNTINNELNRSNIKMDAETILAEVEQRVLEEQFESNFLKFVKEKVTGLASTIANRNYKEN